MAPVSRVHSLALGSAASMWPPVSGGSGESSHLPSDTAKAFAELALRWEAGRWPQPCAGTDPWAVLWDPLSVPRDSSQTGGGVEAEALLTGGRFRLSHT